MVRGLKKAMDMDRISDLPRPTLHHILSHLSQIDAVKTCVLSKSWRFLWHGRPNVEFCKDDFKGTLQKFISVLEQTLVRYNNQNLSIQKLILKMPTIDPVSAPFLEKWIPLVVMRNKYIETFHLCFHNMDRSTYFDLPSVELVNTKCLREICLQGCRLSPKLNYKVLFGHLLTLHLHHVQISEETFERIMSMCPLIEEVSLNKCEGLKTIKVNNRNCSLKHFEFWRYEKYWATIEMTDVSRIETINFTGCRDWLSHYCNNLFTHLKSLRLSCVKLTTKSVDIFSRNFPCLEELELMEFLGDLEEFQLSSRSIKRFAIETYSDSIKVSIDAPNLFEFEYKGFGFPSHISFTTTSNKWKSKIVLRTDLEEPNGIDMSKWLQQLDELLRMFSRSETSLHIVVYRDEDYCRVYGDPNYEIELILKHLELCLRSQLCSDYSVLYELEDTPIKKWNSCKGI